jgi:hypothetical protein
MFTYISGKIDPIFDSSSWDKIWKKESPDILPFFMKMVREVWLLSSMQQSSIHFILSVKSLDISLIIAFLYFSVLGKCVILCTV